MAGLPIGPNENRLLCPVFKDGPSLWEHAKFPIAHQGAAWGSYRYKSRGRAGGNGAKVSVTQTEATIVTPHT